MARVSYEIDLTAKKAWTDLVAEQAALSAADFRLQNTGSKEIRMVVGGSDPTVAAGVDKGFRLEAGEHFPFEINNTAVWVWGQSKVNCLK